VRLSRLSGVIQASEDSRRFAARGPRRSLWIGALLAVLFVCVGLVGGVGSTSADPTCTVNWTGSAKDSLWTSANNWSTKAVPGSADRACIASGITVKVTSGSSQVGSLSDLGTLAISGGELEVTSAATSSSVASLTMSGGRLSGAGAVTVTGTLSWTAGNMSGSGSTVLASGATGTINPGNSNQVALEARSLVNSGTLTWSTGSIALRESAELNNAGTFNANAQYPTSPNWTSSGILGDSSNVWIHNTGTFQKASGTGTSTVQAPFDNQGAVSGKSGQLGFYDGGKPEVTAAGAWSATGTASVAFAGGSFLLGSGVSLAGTIDFTGGSVQAGDVQGTSTTVVLSGGSLELTSASTASNVSALTLASGGTLTGAGTLNVSATLSWTGGTMSGSGSTALGSASTATVNPGNFNEVTLDQRTLANHGTLTWSTGSIWLGESAELDNGGTFNANAQYPTSPNWTSSGIQVADGSNPWIHNTGTFQKASGTGTSAVQVPFDDEGSVTGKSGQLGFYDGGQPEVTAVGSWSATGTASVAFAAGAFQLGSGVAMAGTVDLTGASVQAGDLQGSTSAALALSSGSLEVTSASTASNLYALTQSGGTLSGAATLNLAHSLTWTAGTMSGTGETALSSGATGTLNPGNYNYLTLSQRFLSNQGTLTWSTGTLYLQEDAELGNGGTFNANAQYPTSPYWTSAGIIADSSGAWIHNTGTFQKAANSNTTTIQAPFDNQGSVSAQKGQLAFYDGSEPERTGAGSWSASTGASVAFDGGSFQLGSGVSMAGTIDFTAGSVQAADIQATSATLALAGGSLSLTSATTPSNVPVLNLQSSSSTLSGAATVNITSTLSWTAGTMSGVGTTALASGATGTINPGNGDYVFLEERMLTNHGTLTWSTGSINMREGAEVNNAATFTANSQDPSKSWTSTGIENNGGTAPWIHNTGTFQKSSGTGTTVVSVPFDNQGSVLAKAGQLAFYGGGYPRHIAAGSWTASSGASLAFDSGHYMLSSGATLSGTVHYEGGTVTRPAAPTGSLDALPYASGEVSVAGTGTDEGSGVANATIQVSPAGESDWQTLCGGLTADESGGFGCLWNTKSGAYADGSYQLRARIGDYSEPPLTSTTEPITVLVDNTPPTGTLTVPTSMVGEATLSGTASDGSSGVSSWQPQIVAAGGTEWAEACPAQTMPLGGSLYSCSIDSTGYANGEYQLRALVTDGAGNTYTTATEPTTIDNSEPVESPESSCTDTWTGEGGDQSWQTAANWSTASVPGASDVVCVPAGVTVELTTGTNAAGSLKVKGSLMITGGSLELTDATTVSNVRSLTLSNATLSGAGTVYVYRSFSLGGDATMSGAGTTVVGPSVSGHIEAPSGCEAITLTGRTLVSEGTMTFGWGTLVLAAGAKIENKGVFRDNTEAGCLGAQIQTPGGEETPVSITNTGSFEKTTGVGTSTVAVPFGDEGVVEARSGTLEFSAGGIPEQIADGTWIAQEGSSILLSAGTFLVQQGVDITALRVEGATLTEVAAPSATSSPSISGRPITGETLTASTGSWTGTTPISYSYQWQACDPSGHECESIPGASDGSYLLTNGDIGTTLKVLVTATNAGGSTTVDSPTTESVQEALVDVTAPSISGTSENGQTLTAAHGSWTGPEPIAYGYQWQSCDPHGEECEDIYGDTEQNYTLDSGDVGATVRVVVSASDSTGTVAVYSSASDQVAPGPPIERATPTVAGIPDAGQTLHANPGAWGGTEPEISYQWQRCNHSGEECVDITGATGVEYGLSTGNIGTTIRVLIGAVNEQGSSSAQSDATSPVGAALTLVNSTAPSISGIPRSGHTLTAEPGGWSGSGSITYAYQWQACDQQGAGCEDIEGASASSYTPVDGDIGSALRVLVTATDDNGSLPATSSYTQPIAAIHAPAATESPAISGTAQAGQTLTATSGEWSSEGTVAFSYQWERCVADESECVTISGADESSYTLGKDDAGSTIRVVVTGSASGGTTDGISHPTAIVAAATLVNVSPPTISGSGQVGSALTATTGTWTASGSIAYGYQWQRCGGSGAACVAIAGATSATYTPEAGDVGTTLKVAVAASSTWGTSVVSSAASVTISLPEAAPPTPENTSRPSVEGNPNPDETLTALPGSWSGVEPILYGYQWQVCNELGEDCASIGEATHGTYTLSEADIGRTIRVEVTATDSAGSDIAYSLPSEVVSAPGSPVDSEPPTVSGSPQDGEWLSVETGTWSGSRPLSYSEQWERCDPGGEACTEIEGANEADYLATDEDIGFTLRVSVTAENLLGSAVALTSPTSVVSAVAPAGSTPWIVGELDRGDTLSAETAVYGTPSITTSYQWQRCDTSGASCTDIPGATSDDHVLGADDVGGTVRVTATYTSPYGTDTEISTVTATIADPAPVYVRGVGLEVEPGQLRAGSIITARPGEWTGSVPVSYAYQWQWCYESGELCHDISGATDQTYTVAEGDEGREIRVKVTASNDAGSGEAQLSTHVLIHAPAAPYNYSSPTISGLASEGETLAATSGQWSWSPTSFSYSWERCNPEWQSWWGIPQCSVIEGATGSTYQPTIADDKREIRVLVTATNALGSRSAYSTNTARVLVAPPDDIEAPAVVGEPVVGNALDVVPGTWTGVAIHPRYDYQWQLCDAEGEACVNIDGGSAHGYSYTPPAADAGLKVRVVVTAWSPEATAQATADSPVTAVLAEATPPDSTDPPTLSGIALDGETLTVDRGTWTGSPTIAYSYQWQRCEVSGEDCFDIAEATAATYGARRADVGHVLRAVVSATNDAGTVSATTAPSDAVASAPAPTDVEPPAFSTFFPVVPGESEFTLGKPTFVSLGTWTGDPTTTATMQRCDPTVTDPLTGDAECVDIPGTERELTSSYQYVPQVADIGYALRLTETATNPAGEATIETAVTPGIVGPQSIFAEDHDGRYTGATVVGQTITAESTVASTPELPITTSFDFKRINSSGEDTELQHGSNASYTLTHEDLGHEIEILMTTTVWRADSALSVGVESNTLYTHEVEEGPTIVTAPTITGTSTVGSQSSASHGGWTGGGGTLGYSYQWESCDAGGGSCTPLSGATSQIYTPTPTDVGHALRVVVTASNLGVSGTATSAASSTTQLASAMTNTALPQITGEAKDLQRLSGTRGEWSGSPSVSYAYQWLSCSSEVTECNEIPGATASSYGLSQGDVGSTLKLEVTATNGAGSVTASSGATSVVAGVPAPVDLADPSATVLGSAAPGSMIVTDGGHWGNLEAPLTSDTLAYQWQRCHTGGGECTNIEGGNAASYEITSEDGGYSLRVTVTAENEGGQTSSGSSLSPVIGGALPTGTEKLVYASGSTVGISNSDGSDAHELTTCAAADPEDTGGCVFHHPSVSPTGAMIAVEVSSASDPYGCGEGALCDNKDTSPNGKIVLMNYDGSEPRTLPGNGSQPTWTPDGTTLLYTRTTVQGENPLTHLYSVAADGSDTEDPTPVAAAGVGAESPTYSPDGGQLAYAGRESGAESWGLYTADRNGEEPERLKLTGVGDVDDPQFTPDGEHIIFLATEPPPAPHSYPGSAAPARYVWEVKDDGTELHRLTETVGEDVTTVTVTTSDELIVTGGEVVTVSYGWGVSYSRLPVHIKIVSLTESKTEVVETLKEIPVAGGTQDLTRGVVGPYAHSAATEVCPKSRGVCGRWTAENTERAYQYAHKYHARDNSAFFAYDDDCTDFVSQLLFNGGMAMLRSGEYGTDSWWTEGTSALLNAAGIPPHHSESWALAEKLYHQLRNTGVARPLVAGETPHAGDLVFFHWYPERAQINHVGMIVSGNNHNPVTEIYTSHTKPRFWSMSSEYKEIGESLHDMDSHIRASESARGLHWQWYILRPVHLSAYVPE
jgi:hypothetical protein